MPGTEFIKNYKLPDAKKMYGDLVDCSTQLCCIGLAICCKPLYVLPVEHGVVVDYFECACSTPCEMFEHGPVSDQTKQDSGWRRQHHLGQVCS